MKRGLKIVSGFVAVLPIILGIYITYLFLDYDTMYEYLNLLDKSKSTYKHIKRINEYETSIYLTSKSGQKTIYS